MKRAASFVAVALFAFGVSCGDSTGSSGVATLEISPDPITLVRFDSVRITVNPIDGAGHLVTGVSVVFSSSDTTVVTVSYLGLVRSTGPAGSATIEVQGGGVTKLVPVTVTQVPVAVVLAPSDTSITQGGSLQYRATVVDGNGDPIPGQPLTFESTDASIVTVSGTGLARAVGAAGTVYIIARNGPRWAYASLTVRDTSIIARLPLSGNPIGIAVSGNIAYVAQQFAERVARLNLTTNVFTDSIITGSIPAFITFNAAGTKAYVPHHFGRNVGIIDVATFTLTKTIPVNGDPLPVAISADGNTLFTTTNVNRLYKIALGTDSVVDSISLPATSHHLLMHPNDTLLYVATRDGGSVLEVNWRSMTVVRTFALGGRTQAMAISLDRQELYVADETLNRLRIINLATGTAATPVTLAGGGEGLALSADGTTLYVSLVFNGKVQVIDRVSRAILRTISTGGTPREVVVDAVRSRVLVTNEAGWVDIIR